MDNFSAAISVQAEFRFQRYSTFSFLCRHAGLSFAPTRLCSKSPKSPCLQPADIRPNKWSCGSSSEGPHFPANLYSLCSTTFHGACMQRLYKLAIFESCPKAGVAIFFSAVISLVRSSPSWVQNDLKENAWLGRTSIIRDHFLARQVFVWFRRFGWVFCSLKLVYNLHCKPD